MATLVSVNVYVYCFSIFDLKKPSILSNLRKIATEEKMASSADVRDIMGMDGSTTTGMGQGEITKEMILGTFDKLFCASK